MQLSDLKNFAEINTHSENMDGLKEAREFLKCHLSKLHANDRSEGLTLIYTKREEAPVQLFLGGHYDTVYPANSPFQKVEFISPSRWQGPGLTDMKGGLYILINALIEFEAVSDLKHVGWRLVINPDEEISSPSSTDLIQKWALDAKAACLFEPALPSGELISARKGSLDLYVTSHGKPAHAGRDFDSGVNAIHALAVLMQSLLALKLQGTMNFGEIHGGNSYNVIPDFADLKINFRSFEQEAFEQLYAFIDESKLSPALKWKVVSYIPPKPFTKKTELLLQALDYPTTTKISGGVCDGNVIAALGVPTIDSLGAIGGDIHTPNEFLDIASLESRKELFLRFLKRLENKEIHLE